MGFFKVISGFSDTNAVPLNQILAKMEPIWWTKSKKNCLCRKILGIPWKTSPMTGGGVLDQPVAGGEGYHPPPGRDFF